ncbi:MAG: alpha-L-rhamnosidase, partial [Verrucomicrobiota bacterium]|nr:alpha-L-rhamnosidase [Verrucomicrobiota bacterium]
MKKHKPSTGIIFVIMGMVAGAALASKAANEPVSKWKAEWIAHRAVSGQAYSVQHFRRVVQLETVPETWKVHVSADPRCRLFVNGEEVWSGPARSDLEHWPFATLDLVSHLRPGTNVIGATVWNHGEYKPYSQISERTGFILQGMGAAAVLNTGPEWRVLSDPSYTVAYTGFFRGLVTGRPVRFDARTHPWGWAGASFDASDWTKPLLLGRGIARGVSDTLSPWWLVPQAVPALERTPQRFAAIRCTSGAAPSTGFLNGTAPWTVPAHSTSTILLDQKVLTTAYPIIETDGGRDAVIRMKWAEALFDDKKQKGHRDEIEGRTIISPADVFVLDGNARSLGTMAFRTWRYLELEIETAGEPLVLCDVRSIFTAYPFEEKAVFRSSDPSLEDIWRVGWHTLRLCSGDTYYDCPYYEQLQYVGDTRVQALISLYVSGDDRLMKQAITAFENSRQPEGLTTSRYPSAARQIIPTYSLFWIAMIHDHWMYQRDPEFVRGMLGGMEGVLNWFDDRIGSDGLPGPLPWWNFG